VSVTVAELLTAVQVYVLLTPTASEGLVDDSTSVSSPSGEVDVWRTVGAAWARADEAVQIANIRAAAIAPERVVIFVNVIKTS
jgi:hypothetical protein